MTTTMPKVDITDKVSPNQSERGATITHLVLHNTAGDFEPSIDWLCNPAAKASAHLVVSRSGKTAQLVPFEKKAWHAGNPRINSCSIGIEIEDVSDDQGMPPAQEAKVLAWCRWAMEKYQIPVENLIIHRMVSDKTDCPVLVWDSNEKFFAWRKKNFPQDAKSPSLDPSKNPKSPSLARTTLRMGDKGALVGDLQRLLNAAGYPCEIDEDFGPETHAKLFAYQVDHGLDADSVCGPQTWASLLSGAKPVPSSAKILSVPYFWQQANQYEPGRTCNLTSLAMVMSYQGKGVTPDALYSRAGGPLFSGADVAALARQYGLQATYSETGIVEKIKKQIDNGNPVILQGWFTRSGHFIVIIGYDDAKKEWICNDPQGRWSQQYKGGYSIVSETAGKGVRYSYDAIEYSATDAGNPNSYWITVVTK